MFQLRAQNMVRANQLAGRRKCHMERPIRGESATSRDLRPEKARAAVPKKKRTTEDVANDGTFSRHERSHRNRHRKSGVSYESGEILNS